MNKTHSILKRLFYQKIQKKNKNNFNNKYSNSNLFELKEKKFLSQRQKTFTNINSHNKTKNDLCNILPFLSTLSNFPKLDEKTISFYSDHNSPNKNYFQNYNYINNEIETYNKKPKHKIKIRNNKHNTENFYLTQTNFSNQTNYQTISALSNNNNLNSNFNNKNESLRILSPKNESRIFKNIKFLTPREKSTENYNNIINMKMNKLNSRNNKNSTSFIKKTREKILLNYTLQIKKERKIRIKEKYSNQIENINDIINSLKMSNKLFNEKFLTKFYEYLKYLFYIKKVEKDKNIYLLNKINILKKEITNLNSKIKKIENEKNLIYKWIYLLIKVKEKKIVLEDYYKIIIEEPNNSYNLIMENEKTEKNDSNLNNKKLLKLTSNKVIRTIERKLSNSIRRYSRRVSRKTIVDSSNNSLNQNFLNLFKTMTKAEIESIRKYKYELIFKNVNEFFDCFKILQNENLKLIEIYDEKRNSLDYIKKEKIENENYFKKYIQYTNNLLKNKEIEFLNIKNKNNELLLYKEKLNNNKINIINDNNKNNFKNIIKEKIIKILNIINIFKLEDIFDINIIKSKKLKGNTILDILFTIEFKLNYLLNKINYYKIYHIEEYNKLKNEIENKHKIENAKKLKNIENNKFFKLKEKLEKKMNKIYYLPLKKVDNKINFKTFNKNKILNNEKDYDNNNKFNFNNLMYDIYEKNL